MAAEGGEVLLQRLLIADVSQHLAAPGQPRRSTAGQEQTGPGHQGRQAHTLERHGLAAGVGAGDRHHPQLRADAHRDRHHRSATFAALLPKQQGMAQIPQLKGRLGRCGQLGPHRPQPGSVASPGQARIEAHQHPLQLFQGRGLLPHQATELQQQGPLQLLFLSLQLPQPVAQANHRLGLDEHSAAGGGTVVHQAPHLGGRAGLHRQHRPAAAFGHHGVLQQGPIAAQQLLQALAPFRAHRQRLTPQTRQRCTGAIGHSATLLQAVMEALLQLRQGAQLRHQRRADRPQLGVIDLPPQPPRRRQGAGQGQQLFTASAAALGTEAHGGRDVRRPLKAQAPLHQAIEAQQLGGFGQQRFTALAIDRQGQQAALALAGTGAGEAGQVLRQPGPLQQGQGLLLNRRLVAVLAITRPGRSWDEPGRP